MEDFNDKKSENFFKRYKELLALIASIITSVVVIVDKTTLLWKNTSNEVSYTLLGVDILNFLILVLGLIFLTKKFSLKIKKREFKNKLWTNLKKETDSFLKDNNLPQSKFTGDIRKSHKRTEAVVRQFVFCIRGYILCLSLFYLIRLLTDYSFSQEEQKELISSAYSFSKNSFFQSKGELVQLIRYLTFELSTNAMNLFSGAFLLMGFQVLFSKTVEDNNETSRLLNWYYPITIALFIFFTNLILMVTRVGTTDLRNVSQFFKIIIGVYVGIGMSLIVSRFISMEFFFKRASKRLEKNFYLYGATIILPLYIVVQSFYPLIFVENANPFEKTLETSILLIGFWGKLVFLLFIYTMLSNKWIQLYILTTLINKEVLGIYADKISEVNFPELPQKIRKGVQ